jgi:hypothetical protein
MHVIFNVITDLNNCLLYKTLTLQYLVCKYIT